MKIAVDAQVVLRNHARRMVFGAAEAANCDVVLPVTVAVMAKMHYAKVSTKYVTNKTMWELALAGKEISDEGLGLLIHERLTRVSAGFARWIDEEPKRNDRIFEIGERTRWAQGVAMELARAQVVADPTDMRWEVGEDPYVLAEALEAGAHWIASGNLRTLKPENMEQWLDDAQAQGRFTEVPRPFILDPEAAVTKMLGHGQTGYGKPYEKRKLTRALAHALSEPNDETASLERRVTILARFASELNDCGMTAAGRSLEEWTLLSAARMENAEEHEVWEDIQEMQRVVYTAEVRRTCEAEDRRMDCEETTRRPTRKTRAESNVNGGPGN